MWKAVGIWRNGVGVKAPPELARTVLFAGKYVCEIGSQKEIEKYSNDITEVYHASTETRSVAFFGSNVSDTGLFSLTADGKLTYVNNTKIPDHKKIGNAVLFYDSDLSPFGYVEFGQSFSSEAKFTTIDEPNKSFDKGDDHYDLVDMAGEVRRPSTPPGKCRQKDTRTTECRSLNQDRPPKRRRPGSGGGI